MIKPIKTLTLFGAGCVATLASYAYAPSLVSLMHLSQPSLF